MLTIAELPYWVINLSLLAVIIGSGMLMLMVLIQKPQGGGLAGAFGSGAGSGQTAFGTKTGDALTIATIVVFVAWLLLAIGTNFAARPPKNVPVKPEASSQTAPAKPTTDSTVPATAPATTDKPVDGAAPAGSVPASNPPAPATDAAPATQPAPTEPAKDQAPTTAPASNPK